MTKLIKACELNTVNSKEYSEWGSMFKIGRFYKNFKFLFEPGMYHNCVDELQEKGKLL